MAPIPIVLLKTRSTPHDTYDEYFSSLPSSSRKINPERQAEITDSSAPPQSGLAFCPVFVPVLEHRSNTEQLGRIKQMLLDGSLGSTYGGMIFTSQRAVEAFASVLEEMRNQDQGGAASLANSGRPHHRAMGEIDEDYFFPVRPSIFPIYTVGPATARGLQTLVDSPSGTALLGHLQPEVLGGHTGNGAALASYILTHYNRLHADMVFDFYEAPRLPFIPLLGAGAEQYVRRGRRRMERDDSRLRKRGLLFVAGEIRRDVVPISLRRGWTEVDDDDDANTAAADRCIEVDELEVYSTQVRAGFGAELSSTISRYRGRTPVTVVVVFSPSGCDSLLKSLGYVDEKGETTPLGRNRWDDETPGRSAEATAADVDEIVAKHVVATIGPTTRDHLRQKYNFEPDVCASKPSPEGVGEAVIAFLQRMGLT